MIIVLQRIKETSDRRTSIVRIKAEEDEPLVSQTVKLLILEPSLNPQGSPNDRISPIPSYK